MSPYDNKPETRQLQTMTDYDTLVSDVLDRIGDDADVSDDQIRDDLQRLIENFTVPEAEAKRTVINNHTDGDSGSASGGSTSEVTLKDVSEDGEWYTFSAKVTKVIPHDKVNQLFVVADSTGDLLGKTFSDEFPDLEEGKSYKFNAVVGEEYEGDVTFKLVEGTSNVSEQEEEVSLTKSFHGPLIKFNDKSGLVERCGFDDCSRIVDGRCAEHGDTDGEDDLVLRAVLDDGQTAHTMSFNRDQTEELTGITLEDALDMAREAMNREIVLEEMEGLLGSYFEITAQPGYGDNFWNVESFERTEELDDNVPGDLADRFTEVVA